MIRGIGLAGCAVAGLLVVATLLAYPGTDYRAERMRRFQSWNAMAGAPLAA